MCTKSRNDAGSTLSAVSACGTVRLSLAISRGGTVHSLLIPNPPLIDYPPTYLVNEPLKYAMSTTTHISDQTLSASNLTQLQRHNSHDSYFRAVPTRTASVLGLVSPEFESASLSPVTPLTPVTPLSPLSPVEKDCNHFEIAMLEDEEGMESKIHWTCCKGPECAVRPYLGR